MAGFARRTGRTYGPATVEIGLFAVLDLIATLRGNADPCRANAVDTIHRNLTDALFFTLFACRTTAIVVRLIAIFCTVGAGLFGAVSRRADGALTIATIYAFLLGGTRRTDATTVEIGLIDALKSICACRAYTELVATGVIRAIRIDNTYFSVSAWVTSSRTIDVTFDAILHPIRT